MTKTAKGLRVRPGAAPLPWSDAGRRWLGGRPERNAVGAPARLLEARSDPARTQQVTPQERRRMLPLACHQAVQDGYMLAA